MAAYWACIYFNFKLFYNSRDFIAKILIYNINTIKMSNENDNENESGYRTFEFNNLPLHIMNGILKHLNFADIFSLELVNNQTRGKIHNHFWPCVRILVFHSLEKNIWNPMNGALSCRDTQIYLSNNQLIQLLHRCGKNLYELDLNIYKNMPESPESRFINENDRITVNKQICEHFSTIWSDDSSKLTLLDLSYIRLDYRALTKIGQNFGPTLQVLRLKYCLKKDATNNNTNKLEENIQCFQNFLCAMSNLIEIDIGCIHIPNEISFSTISPKLKKFKAFYTSINGRQFMEIARKAGKTLIELHITTNEDRFDSAVALQQFLAMLTSLETLWLSITSNWDLGNFFIPNTTTLKCLQIHRDAADIYESFLARQNHNTTFQTLERLFLSGDAGRLPIQNIVNIGQHLTFLSISRCSFINDQWLGQIAKFGIMQNLRIILCNNVTWRGFAVFLEYCEKIHLFEGAEQLTDELLEKIEGKMNDTHSAAAQDHSPATNKASWEGEVSTRIIFPQSPWDRRLFQFIRFRRERRLHDSSLGQWLNAECTQSESQNLHPWIIFHEEWTEVDVNEFDPCDLWLKRMA